MRTMLKEERLKMLENYVNQHRYVSYHELTRIFNTSKATIRRDLEMLVASGRLNMVRGGAASLNSSVMSELGYDQKQQSHNEEKMRLAQAAAQLIKPRDTVILDSGTTVRKMVPFLTHISELHVITCDIAIAADLTYLPNVDVTVLGGTLRHGYFNLTGHFAEMIAGNLCADIAFLSFDSVSCKSEKCMITNMDEVGIKQRFIAAAARTVLLCDHSKLDHESVVGVCSLSDIDILLVGKELPEKTLQRFEAIQDRIHLV